MQRQRLQWRQLRGGAAAAAVAERQFAQVDQIAAAQSLGPASPSKPGTVDPMSHRPQDRSAERDAALRLPLAKTVL